MSPLKRKNYEVSFEMITRVQKIVSELSSTLKPELAPDLCKKLTALYTYCYRKLIDANTSHRIEPLDEALKTIRYQRETWAMVLQKTIMTKAAAAAAKIDMPAPSGRMEATISMCG